MAKSLRCVREAPALELESGEARWPVVREDDMCGEFRFGGENGIDEDCWPRRELPIYRDRFGDYCKIPLTQGEFAKVDPEDYIWLSQWRWYCSRQPHTSYAIRSAGEGGESRKVAMHRQIMGTRGDLVCDHINRNGLDNRKQNLRNCTRRENSLNHGALRGSGSRYKGVYWNKGVGRWAACIKSEGRKSHLGYFDTEIEAARAYDRAARELFGEYAYLNFPEGGY